MTRWIVALAALLIVGAAYAMRSPPEMTPTTSVVTPVTKAPTMPAFNARRAPEMPFVPIPGLAELFPIKRDRQP